MDWKLNIVNSVGISNFSNGIALVWLNDSPSRVFLSNKLDAFYLKIDKEAMVFQWCNENYVIEIISDFGRGWILFIVFYASYSTCTRFNYQSQPKCGSRYNKWKKLWSAITFNR